MSDAWFDALVKKNKLRREEIASKIRTQSIADGKQPFQLEEFEELWPSNPIQRLLVESKAAVPEERAKFWEDLYFRQFRSIDNVADFVAELQRLMNHGFFD